MSKIQQLSMPLTQSQIDAAVEFWRKNGGWETLEISQLKQVFPAYRDAIRIKAMAVNALYGTNIRAITAVGDCVQRVLDRVHSIGPDLVEELVVEMRGITKQRNHSFAAKYAHYFIDSSLPILDWYAEWMVTQHLSLSMESKNPKRYLKFFEEVETLKRVAGLRCTCAEIDSYLWVAGEYWYWKRHPKTAISRELKPHFERLGTSPENEPDLAGLLGMSVCTA